MAQRTPVARLALVPREVVPHDVVPGGLARRRMALALGIAMTTIAAALAFTPSAQACSLIQPYDLESLWAGEDAVFANLGASIARLPFDSGVPQGVSQPFFPGVPRFVADPEGRFVVHDDQEGLGADCSGRRFTQAYHANGTLASQWSAPLRPLAGLADGFLMAPDGLRSARLVQWGTWEPLETLDLSFLPDGFDGPAARAAASRDGRFLALVSDDTSQAFVLDIQEGSRKGPIATTVPQSADVMGVALSEDGSRVGLAARHYTGAGTTGGERRILRIVAADLSAGATTMATLATVPLPEDAWWPVPFTWHDRHWVFATGQGVHLIPEDGGSPRLLRFAGESVRSLASSPGGTWLAVGATVANETQASALHLFGPGWLELRTLRPGPDGWKVTVTNPPPPPPEPEPTKRGIPASATVLVLALLLVTLFQGAAAGRRR